MTSNRRPLMRACAAASTLVIASLIGASPASAAKPNILIIWGDDIGYWNVSAYNQGMMGYKTPNIDRIAREGALKRLTIRQPLPRRFTSSREWCIVQSTGKHP